MLYSVFPQGVHIGIVIRKRKDQKKFLKIKTKEDTFSRLHGFWNSFFFSAFWGLSQDPPEAVMPPWVIVLRGKGLIGDGRNRSDWKWDRGTAILGWKFQPFPGIWMFWVRLRSKSAIGWVHGKIRAQTWNGVTKKIPLPCNQPVLPPYHGVNSIPRCTSVGNSCSWAQWS